MTGDMPMIRAFRHALRPIAVGVLWAACTLTAPAALLAQEAVALDDVMEGLVRPAPLTRTLSAPPTGPTEDEAAFLAALPTRGLTIEAREEVAYITEERDLPRIDLDIPFDFNSDALRSDVMVNLVTLGQALTSEELSGYRFIVAGHTDGVGSAAYNQELSERRAASVRTFLIEAFGIEADRLVAIGFGFEQLANADAPEADENRRVEIINLEVGWQ